MLERFVSETKKEQSAAFYHRPKITSEFRGQQVTPAKTDVPDSAAAANSLASALGISGSGRLPYHNFMSDPRS
jgi:hypothetical protein